MDTNATIVLVLMSLMISIASSFRGPHHPKSSISHHHYAPQDGIKLTQDDQLLHDTTHLKEDLGPMGDKIDITKMTEQELEFHYFKLHDVDNNTKLDGLEILHAIQHTLHGHNGNDEDDNSTLLNNEIPTNDGDLSKDDISWIEVLIDNVLEEDDLNKDGYLSYSEFVQGRKRSQRDQTKNVWGNSS